MPSSNIQFDWKTSCVLIPSHSCQKWDPPILPLDRVCYKRWRLLRAIPAGRFLLQPLGCFYERLLLLSRSATSLYEQLASSAATGGFYERLLLLSHSATSPYEQFRLAHSPATRLLLRATSSLSLIKPKHSSFFPSTPPFCSFFYSFSTSVRLVCLSTRPPY